MKAPRSFPLLVAVAAFSFSETNLLHAQNLIQNGGFETTIPGPNRVADWGFQADDPSYLGLNMVPPRSGAVDVFLESKATPTQPFSYTLLNEVIGGITSGATYVLDFYAEEPNLYGNGSCLIDFYDASFQQISGSEFTMPISAPSNDWGLNESPSIAAPSNARSAAITFQSAQTAVDPTPFFVNLDDVSLTPAPEPATMMLLVAPASWAMRRRRSR